MKDFYVYLTTNLITEKQYIGDHFINLKERNYYIGSGQLFLKSVRKHKKYNFFKEIIEWFETREEAFNAQEKYIKIFNTLVPNGYNLSPKGGLLIKGALSGESLIKMRAGVSKSNKGMIAWNKNKNLSKEHKKNLSIGLKGKNKGKILSEETKRNMSLNSPNRSGDKNPMYGKSQKNETILEIKRKRLKYNNISLSKETLLEIKGLYKKISNVEISKRYNLKYMTVRNIIKGKYDWI
jgi:hypothetical protein